VNWTRDKPNRRYGFRQCNSAFKTPVGSLHWMLLILTFNATGNSTEKYYYIRWDCSVIRAWKMPWSWGQEKITMMSFVRFRTKLYVILLGWLNQEGWYGWHIGNEKYLTLCGRVVLRILQILKKFSVFYETRRFTTVFKTASRRSQSSQRWIQLTPSHPV
jgi:hypothetical protein